LKHGQAKLHAQAHL